ncbi:MAG: exodeoxyribonuclease III [Proteobacteria bacterium]|nr:exodeoxyribonuclease III [Pseudomonadota bacterium]
MKIATWNINSVRMRQDRLIAWLGKAKPDVLCLQETKVEDSLFPLEAIQAAGYHAAIFGQRAYNGVAILSTAPLEDVTTTFADGGEEDGARLIAATTHGVRIVDVYVPNGQDLTSDRYPYKLAWLGRLRAYLDRRPAGEPLALCGDMNVTRDDLDVWAPDAWRDKIHCSAPERAAFEHLMADGLTDVFRVQNPEGKVYSWWDYRGVSFFKNQGLRIDFVFATATLAQRCTAATVDRDARKGQDASDHAPVVATFS